VEVWNGTRLVGGLIERAIFTEDERRRVAAIARQLVYAARANRHNFGGVDAFMREYGLSNEEGIILMCIAESLLRIPDSETADRLIAEKISEGAWDKHLGQSDNLMVNASTWGLMLTGHVVKFRSEQGNSVTGALKRLVARSGEPLIRQAVRHAVRILGDQFVLGRTINEALKRSKSYRDRGYMFSYDMLGEAALTKDDATRYFDRYMDAIEAIGADAGPLSSDFADAVMTRPGLSVKLSALHPRFEAGKEVQLAAELVPKLLELLRAAQAHGLQVTLDTEEQDRLDPTLEVFGQCFADPALTRWHGFGMAVQAYGRRAIPVLRWLRQLSSAYRRRIPVRLVKGAYWDSEIKWAQQRGLEDYPVFTRKLYTDVSYLAAMRLMLSDTKAFYPQFASHNAHSLASAYVAAGHGTYEFQRLHGMGEPLFEEIVGEGKLGCPARIYAPVGGHDELLAYLVRRLLENGANASFVNRLADDETPVSEIVADPVAIAEAERADGTAHEKRRVPLPRDILLPDRKISAGVDLTERVVRERLVGEMITSLEVPYEAGPIIDGELRSGGDAARLVICPHDNRERVGTCRIATPDDVELAIATATAARDGWEAAPAAQRAAILELAADLFEKHRAQLMAIIVREAGRTLPAAHDDVREAVDFLRYYAGEARRLFSQPIRFRSVTGEANVMHLRGRGPFACISPWNFPLAIFTGQVAAALAAGNPVLAKPAEQTPITAFRAVQLLHEAGVPRAVLSLLPGSGVVGAALVRDPRICGVAFTGSNETAWAIQKALADRRGAIVPLIAETGGLNAMIADSSALPEQVVQDVVRSAFDSAGQRCSATRVLFVQDDVATRMSDLLAGATRMLEIGDPFDYATDIGPVIDESAQDRLDAHKMEMQRRAKEIVDGPVPEALRTGTYVTPAIYEVDSLSEVSGEVFGPILYVVRYQRGHLDKVIAALNETGFGLTLGVHSRIGAVAETVAKSARVGNLYINRDQIGAVVGVQPFGGEGLSGTGPKAGGPNYVARFATERVRTTDTTATGGNAELLGMPRMIDPQSGKT